jgi:hypothetical protein
MQKIASTFNNRAGAPEHEMLDDIKPLPGEWVKNKTTTGAFLHDATLKVFQRSLGRVEMVDTVIWELDEALKS